MTTKRISRWVPKSLHTQLKTLLIQSLRLGPLPQHVAVIMDGNRRWTKNKGVKVTKGHVEGFEALKGVRS